MPVIYCNCISVNALQLLFGTSIFTGFIRNLDINKDSVLHHVGLFGIPKETLLSLVAERKSKKR